ncbi:RNA polymerase III-inhibiting protein MAF1 PWA37_003719 [Arxiozyma heterogenica]|uniref:RNA polymerase III-inhibiting protein MAF1 n=1 Tax=Arxiozyma heterogenica TaxID=278026 RepID=UPI002EE794D9
MKFIDELDIERINQTLNFETSDCKISGGCDIYTTKPVASDKKLYKRIDHHLEMILQENESYNAAVQQHILNEVNGYLSSPILTGKNNNSNNNYDDNSTVIAHSEEAVDFHNSRRSSLSFWEQKRRMSITEPINNSTNNSGSVVNSPLLSKIDINDSNTNLMHNHVTKTSKLNDQNLKELVMNNYQNLVNKDNDYLSSSSINKNIQPKKRQSSSSSLIRRNSSSSSLKSNSNSNSNTPVLKSPRLRRSSLNDINNSSINIGPFGPINEPSSRRTFAYLIAILNASYPDHDFSSLEPTDFTKSSLKSFISKFENSLYSMGKQSNEQDWIWEIINDHMTLSDCIVYQYSPSKSFLEDEPGYLWNLMGFLFNRKRKRVAFIYLIASRLNSETPIKTNYVDVDTGHGLTSSNTNTNNDNDYDNDESGSYFTFSTKKSKKNIDILIDDTIDQYEGEYDLRDDENAIQDDSEDDF